MSTFPKGARPTVTQTVINADGTQRTVTLVVEATAIKRVRRLLAKRGHALHIAIDDLENPTYLVFSESGDTLHEGSDLTSLARFLGALADDEMIEIPPQRGWRYRVVRPSVTHVDGLEHHHLEPVTKSFKSQASAERAAALFDEPVAIHGFRVGGAA